MPDVVFTRGPRDIPAVDQWFMFDQNAVHRFPGDTRIRIILELLEKHQARFCPWPYLSDGERDHIWRSVT